MHIYSIWHLIRFLICSIYGCLLYLLRFLVQLSEMVVSDIDKKMLEDERIRRIIKANEGKIRDYIKSTNATTHQLKNYLDNKFSVWEQQKIGHYLSPNLLLKYLKICGYSIEYVIAPLNEVEK